MPDHAHLAVAVAAANTEEALTSATNLTAVASLVEYRLDLMGEYDLKRLIRESPLPCIITCRSRAQGGRFAGPRIEQVRILKEACALGAPYVDVEWESLHQFRDVPRPQTKLIGSYHDFDGMAGDWLAQAERMRMLGADIVKLVGMAKSTEDVLIPIAWLHHWNGPGIGIAMGEHGVASRLLAPRFPNAFLSFAAAGEGTAPGQISAPDMVSRYAYKQLASARKVWAMLTPFPVPWSIIDRYRRLLAENGVADETVLAPLPVEHLGPGLLLSLRLAGVDAILCLPGVRKDAELAQFGLDPEASAWRLHPLSSLYENLDAPEQSLLPKLLQT